MKRGVIFGVGFLAVCFLAAGCTGRVELKKPAKTEAVPSSETAPEVSVEESEGVGVKSTEGLATKEELAKAIKGEEIPVAISEGTTREPMTEEESAVFQMINFDFDKSDIRPDARPILENIARYLKDNPKVKIVIEGHCDELGTEEYNMALGERRALSARRYLVSLGVASERIGTISYGEDRPLDSGHNETAWAKNRRCEFRIME